MKIESLTLHHLRMPLVAPFETSFGREVDRECILITMQAEGLTGYGECVAAHDPGYNYETTGTAWHILKDFIAPLILGQDLKDAADFQARVAGIRGHHLAKAGVEMALWDLLGKRYGKSLREMFGGERRQVEVGVSVGLQESPEALVKHRAVSTSKAVMPASRSRSSRAAMSAIPLRSARHSRNCACRWMPIRRSRWSTAQALKPLDDLDLLLIEQPLFEDDIWDHRKLQQEFRTPICLDESIVSPRHARYALEMKACRIINIKASRVGGLSQALRSP